VRVFLFYIAYVVIWGLIVFLVYDIIRMLSA
jgi:hypothetical protein